MDKIDRFYYFAASIWMGASLLHYAAVELQKNGATLWALMLLVGVVYPVYGCIRIWRKDF